MNYLKAGILFFGIILFSVALDAQFTSVSGGLTFSSGVDYNTGTTGNPGLFGKVYLKVNKRFNIVPELSVYNKYKRSNFSEVLKTYMFMGDLNGVFTIYKDKSLRFVGFTGVNATALNSKWDILQDLNQKVSNKSGIQPGLNLGGAFQLFVNDDYDAYISVKYIVSSFNQAVINVGAIYYFGGKHRKGSW